MNQGRTTFVGWSETQLQSELILARVLQNTTLTFCNLCENARMRTIQELDDSIVLR